jgi:hypothetical protein
VLQHRRSHPLPQVSERDVLGLAFAVARGQFLERAAALPRPLSLRSRMSVQRQVGHVRSQMFRHLGAPQIVGADQ